MLMRKNMDNFDELPLRHTILLSFHSSSLAFAYGCVSRGAHKTNFSDRKMTIGSFFVANEAINKLAKLLEQRYQKRSQCQLWE